MTSPLSDAAADAARSLLRARELDVFLAHCWKVERASRGTRRCGARCRALCRIWRKPGAWLNKLASAGATRSELRPAVDHSKSISVQRPALAFVIVRQKLRLVRRDVDVRRAFRFAGFAGKAQVERLLDVLVLPSAAHHFALQHFKQHVRAARACCALPRASPCSWDTSSRCRACGTLPSPMQRTAALANEPPSSGN